ncbi:aminoacyl-tRNA hydrolase [Piscirickettsia salmonis]|uniref:Peptidyl-tRNA hydrolase n=1 Tax=Piscirickettsia salmonis TaxID=1238 RepID=A0A9Q6PVU3_PISSA|nr:aminoacyl-tRNA hydrolase [Piscirickettsia salmonis]RNC78532.1 aminoacyl-tRNA hydrolase [Piscirickettsiaceae bacterium NZ-RLO2]APS58244.1 peptidyl-tRNA hydrolase [Piscirickettsia salmonis]ERL62240.1 peptidyl-tRNA hydrolase [Piscirickettsia salmonis LF-89 = ATCC VR-1361]PEQ16171.1 aminoacyl-tRNA hydrolase [Piscirickettsia salmonis]QGN76560.1 Peptidyl-tRNA hydrolase [Piscirickettsia salmonis]
MDAPVKLIVGLGNPGAEYEQTRHNAGVWFVEQLAKQYQTVLRPEAKFHGLASRLNATGLGNAHLLIPTTFMNRSGLAVKAYSHFYKIPPEHILIVHDELDLPPGTARLKQGGGHGGHNGLRDITAQLGTNDFQRLRIGIGHPGNKSQVVNFVLKAPSKPEHALILQSLDASFEVLAELLAGHTAKAMNALHSR